MKCCFENSPGTALIRTDLYPTAVSLPQFFYLLSGQPTNVQWFCPHTLGRYPKLPQTPKKKEFLHKLLVKHPGYRPGVCGWDLRNVFTSRFMHPDFLDWMAWIKVRSSSSFAYGHSCWAVKLQEAGFNAWLHDLNGSTCRLSNTFEPLNQLFKVDPNKQLIHLEDNQTNKRGSSAKRSSSICQGRSRPGLRSGLHPLNLDDGWLEDAGGHVAPWVAKVRKAKGKQLTHLGWSCTGTRERRISSYNFTKPGSNQSFSLYESSICWVTLPPYLCRKRWQ